MKPPLCRLCGTEHWGNQHAAVNTTTNAELVLTKGVNKTVIGVNESVAVKVGPIARNADRHRPGYMRDYMRRKRASDVKANGS